MSVLRNLLIFTTLLAAVATAIRSAQLRLRMQWQKFGEQFYADPGMDQW